MLNSALKRQILLALDSAETGLHDDQVVALRARFGSNEIPEKKKSILALIIRQFQNVMVYILLAAVVISIGLPLIAEGHILRDEVINATVILAIVLLNAALGFVQERRAENAIALLRQLSAPQVKVRRNGRVMIIPSKEIVPGDIMLIEAGDKISADGRLIETSSLHVNESSMTGESVPVAKHPVPNGPDVSRGMVLGGTIVTMGSGELVVTATGLQSEIGKVTSMVMETESPETPLQLKLKRVSSRIGLIVLVICVLLFIVGLIRGLDIMTVFFTSVSLAVAAVPEGLPAIVTICLAIGVQRMLGKHALIRRLDAIETLGSVTVICADKTGTMTENNMKVTETWLPTDDHALRTQLIQAAASCNRADMPNIGDPTEIALLELAHEKHIERLSIVHEDIPFTSEAKYMMTTHENADGHSVSYAKGAAEVIVELCNGADRQTIQSENIRMAKEGLRVLAVAANTGTGLTFLGLIGMIDPPRIGVKEAIAHAKHAGIRTIMITGDSPITAQAIASKVGIETEGVIDGTQLERMDERTLQEALRSVSVFARVQPVHKVKILEALQAQGEIVSMSGDGVNDAPALKRAHVGIAMGLKGTDIARESSAMVLTDDNYATIVEAVAEGRRIYDNIRKFVVFLLRTNVGEVLIVTSAMIVGLPLPLLPLHILWINLVTDSLPALALAAEKGGKNVMNRPPRPPTEHILKGEMTLTIIAGLLNAFIVLSLFILVKDVFKGNLMLARTTAMTTTILFQFFLAFSTRTKHTVFERWPLGNVWLLYAVGISFGLHLILLFSPLNTIFFVTPLPLFLWIWIIGANSGAFMVFEGCKWIRNSMPKAWK